MFQHKDITQKEYYDKFLKKSETEGICKVCGKETEFMGITKRYREFCSLACSAQSFWDLDKYEAKRKAHSERQRKIMASNWKDEKWLTMMAPVSRANIYKHCLNEELWKKVGNRSRELWANGYYNKACAYGAWSWKGYFRGEFFRSSLELRSMIMVEKFGGVFASEPFSIPLEGTQNHWGTPRTYTPDLLVILDSVLYLIEVKPDDLVPDFYQTQKPEAAEKWCRENHATFQVWTKTQGLLAEWYKGGFDLDDYDSEVTYL